MFNFENMKSPGGEVDARIDFWLVDFNVEIV